MPNAVTIPGVNMPWSKLDDGFHEHPKIVAMSDKAYRLFTSSITYSSRHGLRGRLTCAHLAVLFRLTGAKQKQVEELIGLRSYDRDGDEILIHGFCEYNPNAEEISKKRSEAGKAGAEARWQNGKPMANAIANEWQTDGKGTTRGGYPLPLPEPIPDPIPEEAGRGGERVATQAPSLSQVHSFAKACGAEEHAEKFFYWYESRGWPSKGIGGVDYHSLFKLWMTRETTKEVTHGGNGRTAKAQAAYNAADVKLATEYGMTVEEFRESDPASPEMKKRKREVELARQSG